MGLSGLPGFGCLFIFPLFGKLSIIVSNIFSCPFFLSSSGTSITQKYMEPLTLSQRSLKLFSFLFSLFQILLCFRYFHHSIFQLTDLFFFFFFFACLFASVILLLIPSSVLFHLSYCAFHLCFLFSSPTISLLKFASVFLICGFILCICASILFLTFWITFAFITLSFFQANLAPSFVACSSVVSFSLTDCVMVSADCRAAFPLACRVGTQRVEWDQCFE